MMIRIQEAKKVWALRRPAKEQSCRCCACSGYCEQAAALTYRSCKFVGSATHYISHTKITYIDHNQNKTIVDYNVPTDETQVACHGPISLFGFPDSKIHFISWGDVSQVHHMWKDKPAMSGLQSWPILKLDVPAMFGSCTGCLPIHQSS